MRNLVGLRRAIVHESGRQVVAVHPEEMPLEGTDASFIRGIQAVLAEHLRDEDFNVSELAGALLVSERTLQRRIKELTGFSAGAYLRHVRLLHAKTLFEQNAYQTTAEVAHAVGFKSVPYFARRFAESFGAPPPHVSGAPSGGRSAPENATGDAQGSSTSVSKG